MRETLLAPSESQSPQSESQPNDGDAAATMGGGRGKSGIRGLPSWRAANALPVTGEWPTKDGVDKLCATEEMRYARRSGEARSGTATVRMGSVDGEAMGGGLGLLDVEDGWVGKRSRKSRVWAKHETQR